MWVRIVCMRKEVVDCFQDVLGNKKLEDVHNIEIFDYSLLCVCSKEGAVQGVYKTIYSISKRVKY